VEQLNIEGKRSGEGFVAHRVTLISALSRALSDRVKIMSVIIGRKGFTGYLRALGGSNIVKVIPSTDGASGSQSKGKKAVKVICGSNTSVLNDGDWIGEKTPMTFCEIRVSPKVSVTPNIGTVEFIEALTRVLPFATDDEKRPVLNCVYFLVKDGKLNMVSADGFTLSMVKLDYGDGEGKALIKRDSLKSVAVALRRARRVRVSFEKSGETLDGMSLIVETELIRYKWASEMGEYPDYEKLTPKEFHYSAHFDTGEAIKAVTSLKALADAKSYPIDLIISGGKIIMANPDNKGQAEIPADTEGEGKVRVDGAYLSRVLRASGGMVDLNLTTPQSPMLFSHDGFEAVVMPMMTEQAQKAEQEKAVQKTADKTAEKTPPAKAEKPAVKTAEQSKKPVKPTREKVPATA
jgi:DNA polymerase-3 subunit beta